MTLSHSIVFVIDQLDALETSFQLTLLATDTARQGFNVHVAVLGSARGHSHSVLLDAGVEVHELPHNTHSNPLNDYYLAVKSLRSLLSSINPKIVHSWGHLAQTCVGLAWLSPRRDQHRSVWLGTHLSIPPSSGVLKQFATSQFCKRIQTVVVPSSALTPSMIDLGFDADQVLLIPNASRELASRETARPTLLEKISLSGDSFVAAALADLIPMTRLKDLIWANDLLNCIRDDVHLVIFGNGHQRANLERFAHFTNAADHVHFLPPTDAQGLLGGVDVYWHSHLMTPLSTALLCAMASQIPVISVYGDATEDVILHQQTGMAVNFGARDEFARWTKYLIEKPDARQQMAQQGKEHVTIKFSPASMLEKYQTLIDNVLNEPNDHV